MMKSNRYIGSTSKHMYIVGDHGVFIAVVRICILCVRAVNNIVSVYRLYLLVDCLAVPH